MKENETDKQEEKAAMDAAREWNAKKDHLHDIFSPHYNKSRQRDEALEKWGPSIEKMINRNLERISKGKKKTNTFRATFPLIMPEKDVPDLDRE